MATAAAAMSDSEKPKSDSPTAFDPADITGVVTEWSPMRGFGFAARAGDYDIFVHHKQSLGGEQLELEVGDGISFDVGEDADGRLHVCMW
eukprot:gene1933-18788_t